MSSQGPSNQTYGQPPAGARENGGPPSLSNLFAAAGPYVPPANFPPLVRGPNSPPSSPPYGSTPQGGTPGASAHQRLQEAYSRPAQGYYGGEPLTPPEVQQRVINESREAVKAQEAERAKGSSYWNDMFKSMAEPVKANPEGDKRATQYFEDLRQQFTQKKIQLPNAPKLIGANPNTVLSRSLLQTYFSTYTYPFTRHHIDSFDQFISQDIPAILKTNNPLLILKEPHVGNPNMYQFRTEIFIGGFEGNEIEIGTPTVRYKNGEEIRVLFPNEARLRNLTYASTVYATIAIRVTITMPGQEPMEPKILEYKRMPLFQIPILLHSRYCLLHNKPASFLREAGECPQDQGGYFIVGGSEKILITKQEQSFNTLYVKKQKLNPKVETYGSISSLSPITRQVKMVNMYWMRNTDSLQVTLPFVRKPVPLFVLFRAMGVQSDEDILRLIYPDLESGEAKQMIPLLLPSIAEANPFLDQYSAIQFIKAMTKAFSEEAVYDILYNKTFIHITDKQGGNRVHFLAECVRKFMRVHTHVDPATDKDDTRNQRCLTSGVLIRMLFTNAYSIWLKAVRKSIDNTYMYNRGIYGGEKFMNVFSTGNLQKLFITPEIDREETISLTELILKGFRGKWVTGASVGDEKQGVLQQLSRLSYMDFMSHCRRLNLNFDTGMKLTSPRQLHTSQYGYFCTNETPGGASIGITKNFSLMTMVSTASQPDPISTFLLKRGWLYPCSSMRYDLQRLAVPVFINNGIIGYTLKPFEVTKVLKYMKWTGCLPSFCSVGFSIRNRNIFIYTDEGRPLRPLIHLGEKGSYPKEALQASRSWRELIMGTYPPTLNFDISNTSFLDPFYERSGRIPIEEYLTELSPHIGLVEYIDPYEQNESYIASFPEEIEEETTHCEIHPCTIVSVVNGMIPFANFNQSPRNQLSCSQSKQAVSLYATNFQDRFDNSVNILCYGESPIVRTLQYDMLGEGSMPYGNNIIMAIMPFHGYNRDDGIIFNLDAMQRGLFRNINYRSYETFEEIDKKSNTSTHVANPLRVPAWTDLKPGCDYTKLDERGIIKVGEIVDENTVLVGKYIQERSGGGKIKDASLTPQVWTSGRVESVAVLYDPLGLMLVKVRITQDRTPELGDKFSTRHGQKGTIGMLYRAHDMPRTASGVVPDIVVNPHCIPSRMTVAQLMEMLFGTVCWKNTMIGDATVFMSDKGAPEAIGRILEDQFGLEKAGNEIVYDGESGVQVPTNIFMGPVYGMRLKHMVEDKWNARAEGRREQRTHQPTGGRGNQGGLRIGEMDRDTLIGHGISGFLRESMMERADKSTLRVCNGCGTIPIYNEKQKLFVCSLCDGPVKFVGDSSQHLELLPTAKRTFATSSLVEMPYATKLLIDECETYLNMGMRILTAKHLSKLEEPPLTSLSRETVMKLLEEPLRDRIMPETRIPEYREVPKEEEYDVKEEDLVAMGMVVGPLEQEEVENKRPAFEKYPLLTAYRNSKSLPHSFVEAFGYEGGLRYLEELIEGKSDEEAEAILYERGDNINNVPNMESKQEEYGKGPGRLIPKRGWDPVAQKQYTYENDGRRSVILMGPTAPAAPAPAEQVVYSPHTPTYGPSPLPGYGQGPMTPPFYGNMTPPQVQGQVLQQAPQIQIGGAVQMLQSAHPGAYIPPVQPVVYQSPIPSGPQTFVIDTGPHSMSESGYMEDEQEAASGRRVMGGSRRHTTPRARALSPKRATFASGQTIQSNTRLTINKIG